jgi:hypothetical protein
MNRILIPAAIAALVAGCSMPGIFGQQSNEPVVADSVQTVVVREIYHETPVVYVDTVYLASEPAPVQPVYVEEEHNEYNETYVYVREHAVMPPHPHRHEQGWSPRDRGRQPRDRRRDDVSPRDRNQPRDHEGPEVVNPNHPVKKTNAPVINDRQKSPVPPTQPTPPKRQAPAQSGGAPATVGQSESPKQAPIPSVDKPAAPAFDEVQVGMVQARRK